MVTFKISGLCIALLEVPFELHLQIIYLQIIKHLLKMIAKTCPNETDKEN